MSWEQNLTQEQLGVRVGVKKAQLVKGDGLANTATDFLLRRMRLSICPCPGGERWDEVHVVLFQRMFPAFSRCSRRVSPLFLSCFSFLSKSRV